MSEPIGFTPVPNTPDAPEIGVGMLGYAFMGRAHSNALIKLPHMMVPPPMIPRLIALCGRDEQAVAATARRFGYAGYYTDWRRMLDDERIQLFDNGGSNDIHAEPCIKAAQAGMHILCEKPLARTTEEARQMWKAVQKAGVKAMAAFNYRFVPAIRYAYELLRSGRLGQVYHFRATYLQDWLTPVANTPWLWRLNKAVAGTGAIGDLGTHIIDLARFLVGAEITTVSAKTHTFIHERPRPDGSLGKVDVDDAFAAVIEFSNGVLGTLEASRFATGRKNYNVWEINAENGSLRFNLEDLNRLDVYWVDDEPKTIRGFHNVLVTDKLHPWVANWWPPGHIIGWEHTFVHEIHHLLDCIRHDRPIAPYGADFEDGYRVAIVSDAIVESAETRRQVDCAY